MVYIVFANEYPDKYGLDLKILYASKSAEKAHDFAEEARNSAKYQDVWVLEQGLDVPEKNHVYLYIE